MQHYIVYHNILFIGHCIYGVTAIYLFWMKLTQMECGKILSTEEVEGGRRPRKVCPVVESGSHSDLLKTQRDSGDSSWARTNGMIWRGVGQPDLKSLNCKTSTNTH